VAFYTYVAKSGQSHGLIHPFAWDTDDKGDMNMTIINRQTATVYDQDIMNGLLSGWGPTAAVIPAREPVDAQRLAVESRAGTLHATWVASVEGPAKLVVSDLQGRALGSRSIQSGQGLNSVDIPPSRPGVAIVRVRQGDQQEASAIEVP
jgi:hypothetical protein